MHLFTEYENKLEQQRKEAEAHRLKRAKQWLMAYFNTRQRNNTDERYPLVWYSLNMIQARAGIIEDSLERALSELCYSNFLTYHPTFTYYDGKRSYQHGQVYIIKINQVTLQCFAKKGIYCTSLGILAKVDL